MLRYTSIIVKNSKLLADFLTLKLLLNHFYRFSNYINRKL